MINGDVISKSYKCSYYSDSLITNYKNFKIADKSLISSHCVAGSLDVGAESELSRCNPRIWSTVASLGVAVYFLRQLESL